MTDKVAIVTGDIVNSTSLSPEQRSRLESVLWSGLAQLFPEKDTYDVIRGDSFQILIENPVWALRRSIQMRCLIKFGMAEDSRSLVDSRVSIGLGEISLRGKTVSSSDGSAFQRSGQGLDQLKDERCRMSIIIGEHEKDELFRVYSILMDVIISRWSAAQAEAAYFSSTGLTQQEIADKLAIVQSAVHKRLKTAHWNEVAEAVDYYERTIAHLLTDK